MGVSQRYRWNLFGALVAFTAIAAILFFCYLSIAYPGFRLVAACRFPDGRYECVILEKPPPGLLAQSPYSQRIEIRDRNGQTLPGKTLDGATDSTMLPDPKIAWNGIGFTVTSATRPICQGYVYNGRQIWPDHVESDADLAELAGCSSLREVRAHSEHVTDAGLMKLASCANLVKLQLGQTRVTDASVRRLQAALPRLEIENASTTLPAGGDKGSPSPER